MRTAGRLDGVARSTPPPASEGQRRSALIVGGLFALAIVRRFTGASAAILPWRPNLRLRP